jgi:hypothetical protein
VGSEVDDPCSYHNYFTAGVNGHRTFRCGEPVEIGGHVHWSAWVDWQQPQPKIGDQEGRCALCKALFATMTFRNGVHVHPMKAISTNATRCSFVRSKIVFNLR